MRLHICGARAHRIARHEWHMHVCVCAYLSPFLALRSRTTLYRLLMMMVMTMLMLLSIIITI